MFRRALIPVLGAAATATPLLAVTPAPKDTLVIGMAQFPSSLHPAIGPEVAKSYALAFALRPVTGRTKDGQVVCELCTDLPTLDNGLARMETRPDGTEGMAVTLKLRDDLRWGDGEPVTARDVLFTWQLASNPASGFTTAHPWDRAASVDVVDDHTAVLHLKRLDARYASWDQILPQHVEGAIAARSGDAAGYLKDTAYNSAPTTPGLWNGPYLITSYGAGQQIVLEPNPYWPQTRPVLKRITLRLVENTAALQSALLSGDLDMAAGHGIGLTTDQVLSLRKQYPDRFAYVVVPGLAYEHIDLQRDNPVLADIRVRRALLMAIDRESMAKRLFEGVQPVANTWVSPGSPDYDPDVGVASFDTAGARALLAEAGWRPGSDGICRNAEGKKLSLELLTVAGNRLEEAQGQAWQSDWKAACIDVSTKAEPSRTLFGDTLRHRTYTGLVLYRWTSGPNEAPHATLSSDQIPTAQNDFGGANYASFANAKMDEAIAAARAELDPAKAKPIWADMQRIYAEQLPALPLFFAAETSVAPAWLKDYEPFGEDGALAADVWGAS